MEENKMKKHLTVAAILQIVFGTLNILGGLVVAVLFGFIDQFVDDPTAIRVLSFIGVPVVIMCVVIGGAMVAGAIGLMTCKQWGRVLTLIMAALGLLNIPIGTLKGVYIIWVLVQTETQALFAKGCKDTPAAQ